jgi:hypothetical protein
MLTILDNNQKTNTTLTGTGAGANLLPTSAPTTGAGVAWNSGTGTATATAANDIVRWNGSLTAGQGYSITLNYTMTVGSKIRITNGYSNASQIVATSAVLGASGSVTLFFIATDVNLAIEADTAAFTGTISAINLQDAPLLVATSTAGSAGVRTRRSLSGPSYFEAIITTLTGTPLVGIANMNWDHSTALGAGNNTIGYQPSGVVRNNNATLATIAAYVAGDRIGVAVDPANRLIWFRVNNGNWNNNVLNNPATGVGGIDYSAIVGIGNFAAAVSASITGTVWTTNFSSPVDTPPAGFSSIDAVGYTKADSSAQAYYPIPSATTLSPYGLIAPSLPQDISQKQFFPAGPVTHVSGVVQENSVLVPGRRVDVYDRNTGELLGTARSAVDGSWSVACLGRPKVRIVGSDPTTYNSLVYDNVSPI